MFGNPALMKRIDHNMHTRHSMQQHILPYNRDSCVNRRVLVMETETGRLLTGQTWPLGWGALENLAF